MEAKDGRAIANEALQNEYFGQKLREMRLRRVPRLSQEQLAFRLGVSRSAYANYETGRVAAPFWFANAVAAYFHVDLESLLPITKG